jgi:hypothetical protein
MPRHDFRRDLADGQPAAAFSCSHCHEIATGDAPGTQHRNHCPKCLWSLHVDMQPGDRRSNCRGEMEPIAVWVKANGEWSLLHRCRNCGTVRANRIGGDDNELLLMSLALRPLAQPPFPLEQLGKRL